MIDLNKLYRLAGKGVRKPTVWVGGLLVIVIVLVLWLNPSGLADPDHGQGMYVADRRDLTINVTESGSIKTQNAVEVKSQVEGQTTIVSIVPEGTEITQKDVEGGKVLVELDSSELRERFAQQEMTLTQAKASYEEATAEYAIQVNENESEIKKGQIQVTFGMMDLQKYAGAGLAKSLIEGIEGIKDPVASVAGLSESKELGGSALQTLRDLQSKIDLAGEELKRAGSKLEWTRKLYDKKYVSREDLEADELTVTRNTIERDQAKTSLELFHQYEFPKECAKLVSDYQEACRELQRINDRCRSKLAQAEAKRTSSRQTLDLQQTRQDKLKKQIDACLIHAPSTGMVVYSSSESFWERSRRPIEVGAQVRERQKLLSLNTTKMEVDAQVHEVRVNKVKMGQRARITVEAFPDKSFEGKVLSISPLADPQNWTSPDLKVYTTKVSIDGDYGFLKPGMSAKVEIIVNELQDVLCVPIQAVANRSGTKFCYVFASEKAEPREVQTGEFNENFIAIVSGLQPGEKVSLNPPRWTQTDQPAKNGEDKDNHKPETQPAEL